MINRAVLKSVKETIPYNDLGCIWKPICRGDYVNKEVLGYSAISLAGD